MDFEFSIDEGKGVVVERFKGECHLSDLVSAIDTIYSSPEYRPEYNGIVDLREAMLRISYNDMINFVGFLHQHPRRSTGRWAFVVSSTLNFGLCRMYEIIGFDLQRDTAIFKDRDEALRWLTPKCRCQGEVAPNTIACGENSVGMP